MGEYAGINETSVVAGSGLIKTGNVLSVTGETSYENWIINEDALAGDTDDAMVAMYVGAGATVGGFRIRQDQATNTARGEYTADVTGAWTEALSLAAAVALTASTGITLTSTGITSSILAILGTATSATKMEVQDSATSPLFIVYGDGIVETGSIRVTGTTVTAKSGSALNLGSETVAPQWPSLTTTERNALTPAEGMGIYNETDSQAQMYINGAWVDIGAAGGGGGATRVFLDTTQSTSDAATGADSTLGFTPDEAGAWYKIKLWAITEADTTTVGVDWSWQGDTGQSWVQQRHSSINHTSTPNIKVNEVPGTWYDQLTTVGRCLVLVEAVMQADATTPAAVNFQFRSETSGETVYVKEGSYLEWEKISS